MSDISNNDNNIEGKIQPVQAKCEEAHGTVVERLFVKVEERIIPLVREISDDIGETKTNYITGYMSLEPTYGYKRIPEHVGEVVVGYSYGRSLSDDYDSLPEYGSYRVGESFERFQNGYRYSAPYEKNHPLSFFLTELMEAVAERRLPEALCYHNFPDSYRTELPVEVNPFEDFVSLLSTCRDHIPSVRHGKALNGYKLLGELISILQQDDCLSQLRKAVSSMAQSGQAGQNPQADDTRFKTGKTTLGFAV